MSTIAIISDHASPLVCDGSVDCGGQNIYVNSVARELGRRGYRVDVFTRRDAPDLPIIVEWAPNVRVIHVPAGPARFVDKESLLPYMKDFARWIERFMQRNGCTYRVCHANFFMSGMVAMQLQERLGLPYVITFHALGRVRRMWQQSADRFPPERESIETDVAANAARVIAECEQDRFDLLSLYGVEAEKVDVISCGFEPSELRPETGARKRLGWPPGAFCIVHVGRMVPRKGVDNVIHALARLRDRHRIGALLYIAGGNTPEPDPVATPHLGLLMNLSRELGLERQVFFLGQCARHRLSQLYSAADVFVTTPWYEPFGITPLEAMACARPVIGSAVGGIKTTVVDGATGFLVPPNDPEALAGRLADLHSTPGLGSVMGLAGYHRVRKYFTWHDVVDALLESYQRGVPESAGTALPAVA